MSIRPHRADDWGGGVVEPAAWILGGDLSLFKTLLRVRQAEFEAQTGVHNPVLQSLVSQRGIRLGICAMASAVSGQGHIDTPAMVMVRALAMVPSSSRSDRLSDCESEPLL